MQTKTSKTWRVSRGLVARTEPEETLLPQKSPEMSVWQLLQPPLLWQSLLMEEEARLEVSCFMLKVAFAAVSCFSC